MINPIVCNKVISFHSCNLSTIDYWYITSNKKYTQFSNESSDKF